MNKSGIAVIEGKWFSNGNYSVKQFFDFLSDLMYDSPHQYHYEMFNDGRALNEIAQRLCQTQNIRHIYIAAHGSDQGIVGSNHEPISTTKVSKIIQDLEGSRGKLDSVYFGCCQFGTTANMQKLLTAGNKIRWVAGYTKDVNFIQSTLLDAMFWSKYLSDDGTTPLMTIRSVVDQLVYQAPGLIEELGFQVMAWDGRKQECVSLIEEALA